MGNKKINCVIIVIFNTDELAIVDDLELFDIIENGIKLKIPDYNENSSISGIVNTLRFRAKKSCTTTIMISS